MATDDPRICVDANIIVYGLASKRAPELVVRITGWVDQGRVFHVPSLWRYEVTNALYRSVKAETVEATRLPELLSTAWELPVVYHDEFPLHERATSIALDLGSGAAYDAHYLALTERLSIPFYTCDARLYNAARHHFPLVELVPIA